MSIPIDASGSAQAASATIRLRRELAANPESQALRRAVLSQFLQQQRFEEAVPHARWLVETVPEDPEVRLLLAWALLGAGDLEAALVAIHGHPQEARSCVQLGAAAGDHLGRWEAAKPIIQLGLTLDGSDPDTHNVMIVACSQLFQFEEALWVAQEAEARFAGDTASVALFRFHQATIHLLLGRFLEGFPLLESRMGLASRTRAPLQSLPLPVWQGEPIAGKHLLVRWEQGFGDMFMGARFLPNLAALGAEVILESRPAATGLFRTCQGVSRVIDGEFQMPLDTLQVPIMSIPGMLGIRPDTIPAQIPYLQVPGDVPRRQAIDLALEECPPGRRIGLVWAGNAGHLRDRERSIPPAMLEALGTVPNVAWVGLQKEDGPRPSLPMVDLGPYLSDFSDTAYALSRLDGLISVDTSSVHLAGALGVPTWLLITHLPDWRWMLDRNDSPWYPRMTLWRQPQAGDWHSVLQSVAERLTVSSSF